MMAIIMSCVNLLKFQIPKAVFGQSENKDNGKWRKKKKERYQMKMVFDWSDFGGKKKMVEPTYFLP